MSITVLVGLAIIFFIATSYIQLGINLYRDINGIEVIKVSCLKFAKITWATNGGILNHSKVCVEADNYYGEVISWYRNIGWDCDGGCSCFREYSIGPFTLNINKFLDPFPDRVVYDVIPLTHSPTHFDLYINYDIVFR